MLAVATVPVVLILRLTWYFLLLLAILFYPYAMRMAVSGAFRSGGFGTDLLRLVTPGHEAVLFTPSVAFACGVLLIAVWPRMSSVSTSSGSASSGREA